MEVEYNGADSALAWLAANAPQLHGAELVCARDCKFNLAPILVFSLSIFLFPKRKRMNLLGSVMKQSSLTPSALTLRLGPLKVNWW